MTPFRFWFACVAAFFLFGFGFELGYRNARDSSRAVVRPEPSPGTTVIVAYGENGNPVRCWEGPADSIWYSSLGVHWTYLGTRFYYSGPFATALVSDRSNPGPYRDLGISGGTEGCRALRSHVP